MSSLGTSAVVSVANLIPLILSTFFYDGGRASQGLPRGSCIDKNSITPTGLPVFLVYWPIDIFGIYNSSMSDMVSGFFAGCFPLDAALSSNLDCLAHEECLGIFSDYFPKANQVGIFSPIKYSARPAFLVEHPATADRFKPFSRVSRVESVCRRMADAYQLHRLLSPVRSDNVHLRCERRDQLVLCHRNLHRSLRWTDGHSSKFGIIFGPHHLCFDFSIHPNASVLSYDDSSPAAEDENSAM